MEDIKKAFNQFKKDIKKEGLDLTGRCYMTAKQIKNRTATIMICNNIPYEDEIDRTLKMMQRFLDYDSWTDGEKVKSAKSDTELLMSYMEEFKQFGTKQNEFDQTAKKIRESEAWKKFVECIGSEVYTTQEDKDISMYLRIMW